MNGNKLVNIGQRCLSLVLLLLLAGGCATLRPGADTDPEDPAADPAMTALSAAADTFSPEPGDTLLVLPDLEPLAVPLTVGPDGTAALADLEALCATALTLAAEGSLGRARDHLYTLEDQVERPRAQAEDPLDAARRASLGRRVWLLAGFLTELEAFDDAESDPDSLLAAGYGRLSQMAFPDSLVPATGITLPTITADLLKIDNKAVSQWEAYFTGRGRRHFQIWLDRKAAVDSLIGAILAEEELPRELVYLCMIESGFSSRAVSSVSAVGPWQFMAGTAKTFGLRTSWWVDERRDMELSTRAAAQYLKRLYEQFGDWALVLAAYNSGENRVERKIRQHGHDNFWNLRLPSQTTAYVPKFIAAARIGEDPQKYGFEPGRAEALAYDVVTVDDATDLELIARCAGVDGQTLRTLNPALLRGASPAGLKDYPVRVPRGTRARTEKALRKVPADQRLTWRRHKVQRGETLGRIAADYGTSVQDIARLNKLGNVHLIRPGAQLLIPMPAELAARAQQRAAEKGHYVPPDGFVRVSYQVKRGDTLGGVARKLGVTLSHLRKVNGIYKSNLIRPGQHLYAYRPGG